MLLNYWPMKELDIKNNFILFFFSALFQGAGDLPGFTIAPRLPEFYLKAEYRNIPYSRNTTRGLFIVLVRTTMIINFAKFNYF